MNDHRKKLSCILISDLSCSIGTLATIIGNAVKEVKLISMPVFVISCLVSMRALKITKSIDHTFGSWSFHKSQLREIPTKYDRSTIIIFFASISIFALGAYKLINSLDLDNFDKIMIMVMTAFLIYFITRIFLVLDDLLSD